jgi:alkylation response protein AidB-like acyl-CoA dehydrogenase
VNFAFSEQQETFRAELRRFFSERLNRRAQMDMPGAHDPGLWKEMAALGLLGAAIPETYGGQDLPNVDLCIVFEEAARALLPGPFTSTVVGGSMTVLAAGDDEQRARLLPPIAAGETKAARTDDTGLRIEGDHVSGEQTLLRAAGVADWLMIDRGSQVPAMIISKQSFEAEQMEAVDLTRPRYRVRFDGAGEVLSSSVPLEWEQRGRLVAAAEACGAARGALEMAVAYAKEREQFGKPIGSFQAIKHKAADMMRAVEAARLAVYAAACALDAEDADASVAIATAKAVATDAFLQCATENIQIHGGIGVTWEHDAHLYYRRALDSRVTFGAPDAMREVVANALLEEVAR